MRPLGGRHKQYTEQLPAFRSHSLRESSSSRHAVRSSSPRCATRSSANTSSERRLWRKVKQELVTWRPNTRLSSISALCVVTHPPMIRLTVRAQVGLFKLNEQGAVEHLNSKWDIA